MYTFTFYGITEEGYQTLKPWKTINRAFNSFIYECVKLGVKGVRQC